uniref:Uncharacterized protein n=1 Tax=Rhizophora mucronata TaxID=61149 RepID=A0A2P2NZ70_RHIMU
MPLSLSQNQVAFRMPDFICGSLSQDIEIPLTHF